MPRVLINGSEVFGEEEDVYGTSDVSETMEVSPEDFEAAADAYKRAQLLKELDFIPQVQELLKVLHEDARFSRECETTYKGDDEAKVRKLRQTRLNAVYTYEHIIEIISDAQTVQKPVLVTEVK